MSNYHRRHFNGGKSVGVICMPFFSKKRIEAILDGKGEWGAFVVTILAILVFASTLSFSLDSVECIHRKYEYIVRVYVSQDRTIFLTQLVPIIDILSILPTWINICISNNVPRLPFLRLLRLFKFLVSTSKGSRAVAAFQTSWNDNGSLMLAVIYIGGCLWLFASALQYLAEHDNPEMMWCHPPNLLADTSLSQSTCLCNKSECSGKGCICAARYGSLPSSMFFTLMELGGNYQLAASHTLLGRVVSTCTAIMSVGVFAIPTSLCAAALSKAAEELEESKSDSSSEGDCENEGEELSWFGEDAPSSTSSAANNRGGDVIRGGTHLHFIALQASQSITSGAGGIYHGHSVPSYTLTRTYARVTQALAVLSCISSIITTVDMPFVQVTLIFCGSVEVVCVSVFMTENILRICAMGPKATVKSFKESVLPLADTIAWLPSFVLLCGGVLHPPAVVVLTISLFRIIKYERYCCGFWILSRVIRNARGLLSVGGMATLCIVMFASAALFYTEQDNPDPNVRKFYSSVPIALWTTLVYISGAPAVDYSIPGRFIASFMTLLSVALFAVPIGAIGAGFETVMHEISAHHQRLAKFNKMRKGSNQVPAGELSPLIPHRKYQSFNIEHPPLAAAIRTKVLYGSIPRHETFPGCLPPVRSIHSSYVSVDVLDLSNRWSMENGNIIIRIASQLRFVALRVVSDDQDSTLGYWFCRISIAATLAGVTLEIFSTCSWYDETILQPYGNWCELVVVVWFTLEYLLRVIASGRSYIFSGLGVLDAISTFPWYLAHGIRGGRVASIADQFDGPMRALRVIRIVRLDTYAPRQVKLCRDFSFTDGCWSVSLSLIDDALEDCWEGLKLAMYSFVVIWYFFNEWMYLSEHGNFNSESSHFRSALSSLQYSGMLLTGSYGEMGELTFSGQVCCCVAVLTAVGISAVPAAILSNAFVNVLKEEAESQRQRKLQVALMAQRLYKLRHTLTTLSGTSRMASKKKRDSSLKLRLFKWMNGQVGSSIYSTVNVTFILLSVVMAVLETMVELRRFIPLWVWELSEVIFVIYFSLDYVLTLYTIRHNLQFGCSIKQYVFSFTGVTTLLSFLPFYLHLLHKEMFPGMHIPNNAILAIKLCRILRIIGLDKYIKSFYFLSDVLSKASPILKAAGTVALVVWLGGASLMYYVELGGANGASFESIPDAMYYCSIFLVGDWEMVDFSPLGSILCLMMTLFGVAIFAVPVGILFEGFQDSILEQDLSS